MDRSSRLFFVSESDQALNDDVLQIGLPDINYVIDGVAAAKIRVIASAAGGHRGPDVARFIEHFILEVLIEKSDFPQLVGDVFSDIRNRAVRSDNNFVVFVSFSLEAHHPAAGILSLVLEKNRLFFA